MTLSNCGNSICIYVDIIDKNHAGKYYSETCLERPHVRTVVPDRWSLVTGKINMIYKGRAMAIDQILCC